MTRFATLLIALCAIAITGFSPVYAQLEFDEADIIQVLEGLDPVTIWDVPDGAIFTENIDFPPDDPDLDAESYTIRFLPGRDFFFAGSLTITTNAQDAIGRIQAVGGVGEDMITLDGVINQQQQQQNWGGILIRTDPREQLQGDWNEIMRSGNRIAYCHLLHMNATPIQIGQDNDVAQAFIESNRLECGGFNGITAWVGGIYWFQSNRIENPNFGIQCTGAPDEDAAGFLSGVICNNYISGCFEPAIHVLNEWAGTISNNIIVATDNGRAFGGIECTVSPDAVIANNFVTGFTGANGAGITFDGGNQAWWCVTNPFNNVVTNCLAGVRGNGNAAGDVDFCLFDDIGQDGEYVGGADEGIDCQEDADPEFVNPGASDYHLIWNPEGENGPVVSPAIDAGDGEDPDGSPADIGAFGGPRADDFDMWNGHIDDYIWVEETQTWNNPLGGNLTFYEYYRVNGAIEVEGNSYNLVVEPGTVFEFDAGDFFLTSVGTVTIGDLAEDPVVFKAAPGEDWLGIYAEDCGQNLLAGGIVFQNCIITDATNSGLFLYYPTEGEVSGCDIYGNGSGIVVWGGEAIVGGDPRVLPDPFEDEDDFDEFVGNNRIFENAEFGLCIEETDIGDVYVYGNQIYGNGFDDDDVMHCGLQIIDSTPIFSTTTGAGGWNLIYENFVTGLYCWGAGTLFGGAVPDGIANNGRELEDQDGAFGAEIYAEAESDLVLSAIDVYDETGAGQGLETWGVLVFADEGVAPELPSEVDAYSVFWGGDLVGFPGRMEGDVDLFGFRGTSYMEGFFEAMIASAEQFAAIQSAFDEGEWNSVLSLAPEYIETFPNNNRSDVCLEMMKTSLKRTNGDFGDFREFCLGLVESQEGTKVAKSASWMAIECLVSGGNPTAARAEYAAIAQDEERAGDVAIANMRIFHLDARSGGQRVSSMGSLLKDRNRLLSKSTEQRRNERSSLANLPEVPTLSSCYPNPFNASTVFNYSLPKSTDLNLAVFDLQGREVATLANGRVDSGKHSVVWNASEVPIGVYMIRLEAAGHQTTRMVTLLK